MKPLANPSTKPAIEGDGARLKDALPCPFCGSTWILIGSKHYAICVDCGATGPERLKATAQAAEMDWNTRRYTFPFNNLVNMK